MSGATLPHVWLTQLTPARPAKTGFFQSMFASTAPLDLELSASVRALLVTEGPACAALLACLGGWERPAWGRLRIAGRDPSTSPAVRRRVGVQLPAESAAPDAGTLQAWLARVRGVRGGQVAARSAWLLDETSLSRRVEDATPRELRRLALALALETPEPLLVALHEPWHELSAAEQSTLFGLLGELAREGAAVLVTTHERHWAEKIEATPQEWPRQALAVSSERPGEGWTARLQLRAGDGLDAWLSASSLVVRRHIGHAGEVEVDLPNRQILDEFSRALGSSQTDLSALVAWRRAGKAGS
ncbi:MAG TPA: hypothetical protein VLC09_17520 [Polyangiaceae bacterium]|nr:hypothetical protein [Polyangiaceae bacterium]